MNKQDPFYEAALKKDFLPSCRRRAQILKVQEHVVDFVRSRCHKAKRHRYLRLQESVEWPRLWGYVPIVNTSRMSKPLDPSLISPVEGEIARSVKMLESLPIRLREYYFSEGVIREPARDSLKVIKRCLIAKRWQVCAAS